MSEKHESISSPDLFYCFVNIQQNTRTFRFFIVPSSVVAKYVKEQHQYWLSARKNNVEDITKSTAIRRFRIGLDEASYNIETPLAVDYEDKWVFEIEK